MNEPPVLSCIGLEKSYQMGETVVRAIRGVDLQIWRSSYLAVTGPSGSGKSTLLNLLGLLDRPTTGTIHVLDEDTQRLDDDRLARLRNRTIGFVFQTFNLLPRLSALENVSLPLLYSDIPRVDRLERARVALERVGLGDRLSHRPAELSGGQRQRVAIARALVTSPELILADEPTGNLDQETGREILDLFDDLHDEGRTLVVITHDETVAERAERRIHVVDGTIVESSAPE